MSLPIRAFLMTRADAANWAVEVCRDLDAVIAAWERRADASHTAILHIGFDRPPSSAFDQVAVQFPGRMLFTGSAKHGLPRQFESSADPVGLVEGLPIYLALRGWGYVESEVPFEDDMQGPPLPTTPLGDWADWLIGFVGARPEFLSDLVEARCFSESSYLENEAKLPWEARYRAGLYRYGHLVAGNESDPCAMVRASPPWVRDRTLDQVDLTVRLRNVFDRAGFTTFADVGNVAISDLYGMSNFGRKSESDLKRIFLDTLAQGPRDNTSDKLGAAGETQGAPALTTLLAELHRTLALCDARERDILIRRMGLGCKVETLQGVADDYNITRERIRQIEAKATTRIIRQENWDDVLAAKTERLLANRDYPLPVLGLEAIDPWFAGISEETTAFCYLLANFCGDRVSIAEIAGIQYIGFLTQDEWDNALVEGTSILRYAGDKRWTEGDVVSLLAPALPEKAREFRSLLWEELSKQCHFSTNDSGQRILVSFGRNMESVAEAVLMEAESPIHYSEIAKRIAVRLGKSVDVRRVHNAAANVGILLGRGVFGMAKHLNVEASDLDKIAEEASGIVLNGPPGRQWHAAELLGGLIERGFEGDYLDKYLVDHAMRRVGGLTRLGRMAWTARNDTSTSERIEVREAVESLVSDAGRPLTTAEIRQRLVALRGVNDTFQFTFADPLIRVGPGLWGLNDRDVPICRKDQPLLIEHLVAKLRHSEKGIHASEISEKLDSPWNEIAPQLVLSIGILDQRLRVSVGQFLYLAEWNEPRRETVFQIVQRLVDAASGSFTTGEIVRQLETEITLQIDTSQVSACIRSAGATFDPLSRTWSADQQADDFAYEEAG